MCKNCSSYNSTWITCTLDNAITCIDTYYPIDGDCDLCSNVGDGWLSCINSTYVTKCS